MNEKDPNGKDLHEGGAKADAGKNRLGLVLGDFSRALELVGQIGTAGAAKYSDRGWLSVPDATNRYTDALLRHLLAVLKGEETDACSGQPHAAHVAWNALAVLELGCRKARVIHDVGYKSPDRFTYIKGPHLMRFKIVKIVGKGKRAKFKVERSVAPDAEIGIATHLCDETWKIATPSGVDTARLKQDDKPNIPKRMKK